MTYDEFHAEVVKQAKAGYGKPVCVNSVKESYGLFCTGRMTLDQAVETVIFDSAYHDDDWVVQ